MHEPHDPYSAPVFRALTEPIRIAGLPRKAAIALWGLAAGIFAVNPTAHNLLVFPGAMLVHGVLAVLTRNDPEFLLVFLRGLFAAPLFIGRTRLLARERRLISFCGWSLYSGRSLEP
jgi:type IV secretory pathway VirB3-like protein